MLWILDSLFEGKTKNKNTFPYYIVGSFILWAITNMNYSPLEKFILGPKIDEEKQKKENN
jgi:hypothetical protein